MPYKWVKPELFFKYGKIKVYHTYHDGFITDRADYWFTTDPETEDLDGNMDGHFDIRDVFEKVKYKYPKLDSPVRNDEKNTKLIIHIGIKEGLIK